MGCCNGGSCRRGVPRARLVLPRDQKKVAETNPDLANGSGMTPERLQIEKIRRDAIRKALGKN